MKKQETKTVNRKDDLPDTKKDQQHLQGDEGILDLPGVEDIPGQEHIHVAPLGELADTTISSADEEGEGILDDPDETEDEFDAFNANVTKDERKALKDATEKVQTDDEKALQRAKLDNVDEDGDKLNETTGLSGNDLDIPGSEDDDADELIGEEDEENNSYSLDQEKEDDSTNRD